MWHQSFLCTLSIDSLECSEIIFEALEKLVNKIIAKQIERKGALDTSLIKLSDVKSCLLFIFTIHIISKIILTLTIKFDWVRHLRFSDK